MTIAPYRSLPDLTGGTCLEPDQEPANWHPEGRGAVQQAAEAKKGCARCPVQSRCLEDALLWETNQGTSWGIWGGLDEYERAKLLKKAATDAA